MESLLGRLEEQSSCVMRKCFIPRLISSHPRVEAVIRNWTLGQHPFLGIRKFLEKYNKFF